jgi:hypothetical protein
MNFFIHDKYLDDVVMFQLLELIDFYSGSERKKMLKVPKGDGSMLYGNTWKGFLKYNKETGEKIFKTPDPHKKGLYLTKVKAEHPELEEIFQEYADKYFCGFDYKQIQLNRNFPTPPHNDKNKGDSICIAFGEYEGGELCIEQEDGTVIEVDPRIKPVKFNGKKCRHWVNEYTGGTRYSMVFFNN